MSNFAKERFVQVEVSLPSSKLIDRAIEELHVGKTYAVGLFTMLWIAALALRTRGDLSERSDRWIEEAAGWTGGKGEFAAFVRRYHLDEQGVIRDFDEKYGKLDVQRTRATARKRVQRAGGGQAQACPVDKAATSEGLSDDSPVDFSISQSVSPVVDLEQGKGEREREGGRAEAINVEEHAAIGFVRARFGEWASWPIGLVRGARNPDAVAATLVSHLDGMHGPKYSPEVVALAAREYAASDEVTFKARFFAGFVRRAEDTIAKTQSRVMAQNETRWLRAEQHERGAADAEIAADEEAIRVFERTHDLLTIERMKEQADALVSTKWKGAIRANMVRARYAKLIREDGQSGGALAAS